MSTWYIFKFVESTWIFAKDTIGYEGHSGPNRYATLGDVQAMAKNVGLELDFSAQPASAMDDDFDDLL